MITAREAAAMTKKANETINKEHIDRIRGAIESGIMSEADSGNNSAYFTRDELGVNGVIYVAKELTQNGFKVEVKYDNYFNFTRMYVSW